MATLLPMSLHFCSANMVVYPSHHICQTHNPVWDCTGWNKEVENQNQLKRLMIRNISHPKSTQMLTTAPPIKCSSQPLQWDNKGVSKWGGRDSSVRATSERKDATLQFEFFTSLNHWRLPGNFKTCTYGLKQPILLWLFLIVALILFCSYTIIQPFGLCFSLTELWLIVNRLCTQYIH